ncbi:MAG: DUF3656 domain-containing U32 family peptidase [Eubacteriaceae bacterium]
MKKPELLAPVGNVQVLKAAVFAGADAVYLGGKEFNARLNAENFSREELADVIEYCHLFNKKVYATINILIKDKEIKDVLEYIHYLYSINVDAIIIQDMGLFFLMKKIFSSLPIHSSTQMFIHSIYGVQLLESLGYERIVLARELAGKEIKDIVNKSKSEIKIFNHGAMCICYSGQCLMSSMIGGRSGNRGCCAQPCRKYYELWENNKKIDEGYLLSPKDLNTTSIFEDIINNGVHSLKIEGRKKNADYVYTVVSAYRKLIDSYFKFKKVKITNKELKNIEQVFNRKFTSGYSPKEKLSQDELIVKDMPKNRGIYIGKINKIYSNMVSVILSESIFIGDGLLIKGKENEFGVYLKDFYNKENKKITQANIGDEILFKVEKKVKLGDKVFKTKDSMLEKEIKEILSKDFPYKLPIKGQFVLKFNEPIYSKIQYNNICVEYYSTFKIEKAINKSIDKERVKKQINKLGGTPFYFEELTLEVEDNISIPISQINEIRRIQIKKLIYEITDKKRTKVEIKTIEKEFKSNITKRNISKKKFVIKTDRLELINEIIKSDVDEIIFGGDIEFDRNKYLQVINKCKSNNKDIIIAFPKVTRKDYLDNLLSYMDNVKHFGMDGVLLSNYELINIFFNSKIPMEVDWNMHIFNKYTLMQFKELNIKLAYLSVELNNNEIDYLTKNSVIDLGIFVHGNNEVMISEYNLIKLRGNNTYLKDKRGYKFPVYTDNMDRTHIYNSKKTSLYDEIDKITGINKYRIDVTDESIDEVLYTIEGYNEKLKEKSTTNKFELLTNKNEAITKGHFKRGV